VTGSLGDTIQLIKEAAEKRTEEIIRSQGVPMKVSAVYVNVYEVWGLDTPDSTRLHHLAAENFICRSTWEDH
jgi:hypothetical protein